ncbi:MAG: MerR family transcriptional regulator [Candidatus Velthaea sp.]|jgi:DNA-binding transcriptional MerR regulator
MPSSLAVSAPLLSVAAAAGRLGVSTRTLRYYEELGLLTPSRTAGGHRLYDPSHIEAVERILRMQALGLSLTTIRRILHYRLYRDESGRPVLALEDLRQVVIAARADVEAVHDRIETLRRELDEATNEAQGLERDVAFLEQRLAERTAAEP